MKSLNGLSRHRWQRTSSSRHAQLLVAFDRSGFSAAAFPRQDGIGYTTFCWLRQRWVKTKALPAFVESRTSGTGGSGRVVDWSGGG